MKRNTGFFVKIYILLWPSLQIICNFLKWDQIHINTLIKTIKTVDIMIFSFFLLFQISKTFQAFNSILKFLKVWFRYYGYTDATAMNSVMQVFEF